MENIIAVEKSENLGGGSFVDIITLYNGKCLVVGEGYVELFKNRTEVDKTLYEDTHGDETPCINHLAYGDL